MLKEGIQNLLTGYVEAGKAILRGYIKATVGFEQLGAETGTSPKSQIRMFGPTGNPRRAISSPSSATCNVTPG